MRSAFIALSLLALTAAGCSRSRKPASSVVAAGDKAVIGPLVYSVIDSEVTQQLGEDPKSARTPQERFYLIRVSVTNASSDEQPIPTMTLVDDTGKSYTELTDGTGVTNWLGVVRRVGPTQTEQGVVLFDAPTKHYHLRLNDPLDEREIAIDVPLNLVPGQLKNIDADPGATALTVPGRR